MLTSKPFRGKDINQRILQSNDVEFTRYESIASLKEKMVELVSPTDALQCLSNQELHDWCADLDLSLIHISEPTRPY